MSWLSSAWHWYAAESRSDPSIHPHAALVNPVVAGVGAALLIGAALQQAATARRRHNEQTDADRQRRITESFSRATEQLGSDKIAVRLGGIYTLERISRESLDDYWTVMETLCAFVRERARRGEPDTGVPAVSSHEGTEKVPFFREPSTDVAAVLAVIVRRNKVGRKRERVEGLKLNFGLTDLSFANLSGADLSRASFNRADLSFANLSGADFSGADLTQADLYGASGDAKTLLPEGVPRPKHWLSAEPPDSR